MRKVLLHSSDEAELISMRKIGYVWIKLCSRCNAKCSFCDCWKTKEEPFVIDIPSLVEQLKAASPLEINLSGGEVVMTKKFWELLEAAEGRLNWSITTNGTLLMPAFRGRWPKMGVKRLFISIDSHIDAANNASRGLPGILRHIREGVAYLRVEHPEVSIVINHVVTNLNYGGISEFLSFCRELSADAVNLIPIKDAPELFLDPRQIQRFYEGIEESLAHPSIRPGFLVNGKYRIFGSSPEEFQSASAGRYAPHKQACLMPHTSLFIDCQTGDVYPCDTTMWRTNPERFVMGNMLKNTLDEIWRGVPMESFRDRMYPEIKEDCVHNCDINNCVA